VRLYDYGFKKRYGKSYDDQSVDEVCQVVLATKAGTVSP
jgi:hypothetical protein